MLRLWGTSIGDAGLAHLKGLPSLYWLELTGTAVTNEGMTYLDAWSVPRCRPVTYDSRRSRPA